MSYFQIDEIVSKGKDIFKDAETFFAITQIAFGRLLSLAVMGEICVDFEIFSARSPCGPDTK